MATFSKVLLSGSTQGKGIKIVGTASTSGTTIHATGTSSTTIDEIWLYAYNSDTVARNLVIQFGGTTAPDNEIKLTLATQSGHTLVLAGCVLTGTGAAANTVSAYSDAANVIVITGYVNRIA